jgi:hypothetical protein
LPDGKTVLSREEQGTRGENLSNEIRFWDADNGRLLRSFQISGRDGPYPFYALSPDGKTFAAPGDTGGGGLRLWDTISGRLLVHLKRPWYVTALAFSPDSKTLASGNWDTTVLLWDLSQIRLQSLWAKLAAGNDETARAIKRIEATPEKRVAFVKEALLRLATLERRVAVLITDLDNDSFKVRENASRNLEALGPGAEVAIRSALKAESSPEVSKRLREILTKLKQPKGTSRIMDPRSARVALAVLEEIGSPEARKVLRQLAKSQPGSWLTRGAAAALQRLEKRGQTPKKEKP